MDLDIGFIERDLKKIQKKDPSGAKVLFRVMVYLEQQGFAVSRPKADKLMGEIFELRAKDYRDLYAYVEDTIAVLLVVFQKKSPLYPHGTSGLLRSD